MCANNQSGSMQHQYHCSSLTLFHYFLEYPFTPIIYFFPYKSPCKITYKKKTHYFTPHFLEQVSGLQKKTHYFTPHFLEQVSGLHQVLNTLFHFGSLSGIQHTMCVLSHTLLH